MDNLVVEVLVHDSELAVNGLSDPRTDHFAHIERLVFLTKTLQATTLTVHWGFDGRSVFSR